MCLLSFLQLHLTLLSKQTFCVIVNYLHLKWIYLSFSKTTERFLLPHLCSSYTPHSSCSTFFQNPLYLPHFYFHIYARSMLCPERPIFSIATSYPNVTEHVEDDFFSTVFIRLSNHRNLSFLSLSVALIISVI